MSERIYARLLRLFPSEFQEKYGKEALQLFRDRWQDERALFQRLRLCLDLFFDLAVAVPRQHSHARSTPPTRSPRPALDGTPIFHVPAGNSLRPRSLALGFVFAAVSLGALAFLNGRPVALLRQTSKPSSQHAGVAGYAALGKAELPPAVGIPNTPAGKVLHAWLTAFNGGDPTAMEAFSKTFDPDQKMSRYVDPTFRTSTGGFYFLSAGSSDPMLLHFHLQEARTPMEALGSIRVRGAQNPIAAAFQIDTAPPGAATEATEDLTLDSAERHRVMSGAIANLKEYYVYPDVAQKMADSLLTHEKRGDDNAETDGVLFAAMLTDQMRAVSHDKHLRVMFNPSKTPERASDAPTSDEMERYRAAMKRRNCSLEKVGILSHNIGYLKFNEFPDPVLCQPTVEAAMKSLRNVDALIFDLRDNRGGDPRMVSLVCSYLFDRRTHLNDIYDPHENSTQEFWTSSPIPGNTLANKSVYVLTSSRTFSGAEEFSNDLKNLKRATLVGETTGGGAHLVYSRRIDEHFSIGVPFARPINPVSKTDWEGTGVEPDVRVNATYALEAAQKLAQTTARRTATLIER